MITASQTLTPLAARRIALAAQGFGRRRPADPGAKQIRELVDRLGVLQLDSVNVFLRAHYMPVFSRLGPYDRAALDRLAAHTRGRINRRFVEYWAHEAALIPIERHPLFRWRMAGVDEDAWGRMARLAAERPELVEQTLQLVAERGPIRGSETGQPRPERRAGEMWNWHEGKVALEYLFWAGRLMAARRINFERLYDLPERVLPAEVLAAPTPSREDAQRELVRISAAALGVATEPDLGDYFRLPRADSKQRVAELVAAGELEPVTVRGWPAPAYLWPAARRPRRIRARALLSPFDPLVWFRPRAERLFGFRYRIEIYTPAEKRIHGYYVLPFLLGERLVARVDLKSDRQRGVLLVQGAFAEDHADRDQVAPELAAELRVVADWLGLTAGVEVRPHGDLAPDLAQGAVSLRAVLFDLDDTLIPERPSIVAAYAAIGERVWGDGSAQRAAMLRETARAVWKTGRPEEYARRVHFGLGEALYGEFVADGPGPDALRAFVPRLHAEAFEAALPAEARGTSPQLVALWKRARMEALAPYPSTIEVLDHWLDRLPLALVTNGASRLQRAKLAVTGLDRYFDTVIVAEEAGVGKPDPRPFHLALERLDLSPEEVVMVGNDARRDVGGADAAGIRAIHVVRDGDRPVTADAVTDLSQLAQRLP